jgi:hypothetical protein
MICDSRGVLSSVLHGPEQGSPIAARTRSAVYTIYAPAGIATSTLLHQLHDLEHYLRLFSPGVSLDVRVLPSMGKD